MKNTNQPSFKLFEAESYFNLQHVQSIQIEHQSTSLDSVMYPRLIIQERFNFV